jgi:thioredoxin-related protein
VQTICYAFYKGVLDMNRAINRIFKNLAVILVASLPLLAHAEAPEGYPFLSYDKAMQQAQDTGKPLFIYFGRYGCGYCDKTNKETFTDPGVKKMFTENYILAYVDSESGKRLRLPSGERITERELGTRFNAFVTPVFSYTTVNGDNLARLVGVQRIIDFMDAHKEAQQKLAQLSAKGTAGDKGAGQ